MDTRDLENAYDEIEDGIPTVDELLEIPVEESGEEFVKLEESDDVKISFHNSAETVELIGPVMLMRKRVAEMITEAGIDLKQRDPNLRLCVFYSYRPLEVQQQYYDSALIKSREHFPHATEVGIRQFAHVLAAHPEVAGHPTGGALDVTVFDLRAGGFLDLGVDVNRQAVRAAGKKIYTLSPEMPEHILQRRMLLRDVMKNAGFAPFDGEFWHFSFGDREWALTTGADQAMYSHFSIQQLSYLYYKYLESTPSSHK